MDQNMIRLCSIVTIIGLCSFSAKAQDDALLQRQFAFFDTLRGSFEGYQSSDCKNTISYHSLRNDVTEGLITRASDGTMDIEWETQQLPETFSSDGAWFVWLAATDLTDKSVAFEISVDGKHRFTSHSGEETSWSLTHPEGGILTYHTFDIDGNGDSHGYMALYAPGKWLHPGKSLHIRMVGEAAGEHVWIIVFRADDVMQYLEEYTAIQVWLDISIHKVQEAHEVVVTAPAMLAGKVLNYRSGEQEGSVVMEELNDTAAACFRLERTIRDRRFTMYDDRSELVDLEHLQSDTVVRKILHKAVIINKLSFENGYLNIACRRRYIPGTVESLLALNGSKLSRGDILLMNSSHQDIAWMDSPEKCILERDTMLISPLIEQAAINPAYRFDIEDALMIREYIGRHPDKKDHIRQLLKGGQISCGGGFTQPYEESYSGESLARQFYFGKKWLKDQFDYDANVYWNVDVPGRTLQMPQILKKSGIPYMMISRHEKGIFNWYSPDGSAVTTYSSGHYAAAYTALHKEFYEVAGYLARSALEWEKYYSGVSAKNVAPLLSDWDMSPANDYSEMIKQWESISDVTGENGKRTGIQLPGIRIVTTPELFRSFMAATDSLTSIRGERPALWLYIHGPGHQKALKASREGDILLTMAEKFATIDALTTGSLPAYPSGRFNSAWEAKIYPDHGWGGKHGQITDALFTGKYMFARSEASQLLENAIRSIASQVKTNRKKGIPVVVFNSLSWNRSDLVNVEIDLNEQGAGSLVMHDGSGNDIPVQYQVQEEFPDGTIRQATLSFMAVDVPSVGYKTFYLKTLPKKTDSGPATLSSLENNYFTIAFGSGGLSSIYDKTLQKELIDTIKFMAGELFTMRSAGTGAGEFDKIQQPDMEGFAKTGDDPAPWIPGESGAVFSSWSKRSKLPYAVVEQRVILYHQQKRIDFEISLLNWEGVLFREFRMAVPLKMANGQVSYEVPFGVVEVGKDEMEGAAGERYLVPARELHPRGIGNWIGASDARYGVTLSSPVAVADYIDPTDDPLPSVILQPILLASRRSCHWEGNEYLQTGNHYFTFTLTSHKPGWIQGYKSGRAANEKLVAVVNPHIYADAGLPSAKSFFSIDQEDVVISAIKKSEDDESVVVRMYDLKGQTRTVQLNHDPVFNRAVRTTLIEENKEEIPLKKRQTTLLLGHHAIETVKLYPTH